MVKIFKKVSTPACAGGQSIHEVRAFFDADQRRVSATRASNASASPQN
jgi:hypothetical protein